MQQSFVEMYLEKAIQDVETVKLRKLTEDEIHTIRIVVEARLSEGDFNAVLLHPKRTKNVNLKGSLALNWVYSRKPYRPIITGEGTFFKCHDESPSILYDLLTFLGDQRDVDKGKMFQLIREGFAKDDPKVKMYDQFQKIWKLLGNSFYGAFGEKGFHFYNPDLGPAVTYTGQLIISATVFGFETMLTGNAWIKNAGELWRHVASCLKTTNAEEIEAEWGVHPNKPTKQDIVSLLVKHCANTWDAEPAASKIVSTLTDRQLDSLMYRGCIYNFMEFPKAQALLEVTLSGPIKEADAKSINKTSPDALPALQELWQGIKKWVYFNWFPDDLVNFAETAYRDTVILGDTDSTFVYLKPWMKYIESKYDLETASDEDRLTITNVIIYIMRLSSDFQMYTLMRNLNSPEEKAKLIYFKSEFINSRLLLTNGKKNYISLQEFQEGAKINGGQFDIKGLKVKKVDVPRSTSKRHMHSIEHNIIRSPVIDRVAVLQDMVELENEIRTETLNGSTQFITPSNLKRPSEYADPYSQPNIRGSLVWNSVYTDEPLQAGDRIILFQSIIGGNSATMVDMINNADPDSDFYVNMMKIYDVFFGAGARPELAKNGINWIALPKDCERIPEWMIPLIDIDHVLQTNLSPMNPVLESINISVLRNPKPEQYSNTILF